MKRRAFLLAAGLFAAFPAAAFDLPVVPFYGPPEAAKLADYPTVILQPGLATRYDVEALQKEGVRVLGYVSLGEDDRLRRGDGEGPGGQASWYLDEYTGKGFSTVGPDGAPDVNADWGSYYVDPSNRAWRKVIETEVRRMRTELGMDGVFADTALIPRDVFVAKRERRMERGMKALVHALKRWSDGGIVVVNNGWEFAGDRRIDGILIESTVKDGDWTVVRRWANTLQPFKERGAAVSALIYLRDAEPAAACRALSAIGLPAALYRDDEAGRALTSPPLRLCP